MTFVVLLVLMAQQRVESAPVFVGRVPLGTASIQGRVVRSDGRPIARATVRLIPADRLRGGRGQEAYQGDHSSMPPSPVAATSTTLPRRRSMDSTKPRSASAARALASESR